MHMNFSVGTGRITDIQQAAQLARTAEESGYTRISFPDTPAFNRDVHVMMTIAALNTHRIHVGQGFTDPFTFHPFVIANATATVDELSGGRAYVGLGAGGPYGKSMKPVPIQELRDAVQFIKAYTSGEEVEWKGARLHSEWIRRPLPIYLAVEGPKACQLAGELADGIVFLGVHPEHVKWRLELIEKGAQKVGRRLSDIDICARGVVYPCKSKEEALSGISPHFAGLEYMYNAFQNPTPDMAELRKRLDQADPGLTETLIKDYDTFAARRQKGDEHQWSKVVSQRSLDFFSLAGTPNEITHRIEELGRLGVSNISTMLYTPMDKNQLMRLISDTIMPDFSN
jgi:5,10-methylenetetrahydromethanopterin reductase